MCGIAGIATRDGLRGGDPALLDRMLQTLAHRGPDDHNAGGDARTLLGIRRLSIIDLEGGRQPQTDESGLILATQNGEIYNYVELRDELIRRGHVLRTRSDTETIVHLYEEHGLDFVQHLRGMFAIAIWDGRVGRLVLARDRLGKKPLYWRLADGRLSYGSELKAIVEADDVPRVVDRDALALYLEYEYVPAPWTILKGIFKLPPASVLSWDGDEPTINRYWSPSYEPKSERSFGEDMEQGIALLRESVRLRLRSDVPVGVFLSGGMDSSVVTALMAEASAEPVQTFSIGFEDQGLNELPYARAVAERYSTRHTEEVMRLNAISLLPELAEHYDEPFADSSAVPTFRVAQLAARELKVVLTGDGGDESFGGYPRYQVNGFGALSTIPAPLLRAAARSGRTLTSVLAPRSRLHRRLLRAETLFGLTPDERYLDLVTIMPNALRTAMLGNHRTAREDAYLLDVLRGGSGLDRMLRADVLTYLPECLLVKMDRATMANSLEARAPLLDHHVVEFAAALPEDRKVHNGTSKVLLRAIAKTLMPEAMVERPKMGFGVPLTDWFKGPFGSRFEELVLAPDAVTREHLDQGVAASMLADHRSGRVRIGVQLWSLLMFELWGRRWLRGVPAAIG